MKEVQHKKYNMKKVQHGKSVTGKNVIGKIEQHEKRNMKKVRTKKA